MSKSAAQTSHAPEDFARFFLLATLLMLVLALGAGYVIARWYV